MLRRIVVAAVAAGLIIPAAASAAPHPAVADCVPAQPAPIRETPQQSIDGRAAGDDPVSTQPAKPTCDDAGYELAFPDAPLATDAAAIRTSHPSYALPRTDAAGDVMILVLLGLAALLSGLLGHVIAFICIQENIDHA